MASAALRRHSTAALFGSQAIELMRQAAVPCGMAAAPPAPFAPDFEAPMSEDSQAPKQLDGVTSLSDLVMYQPGAVVSRTILKKASGTVTAFAFDQDEGLSEHTAAFEALIILLEGESEVSLAGVPHHLSAGDLLRLPAGRPHAVKALKRFKMLLIMIKE
jgi:quercetin dioxygenase-like cupin family protein